VSACCRGLRCPARRPCASRACAAGCAWTARAGAKSRCRRRATTATPRCRSSSTVACASSASDIERPTRGDGASPLRAVRLRSLARSLARPSGPRSASSRSTPRRGPRGAERYLRRLRPPQLSVRLWQLGHRIWRLSGRLSAAMLVAESLSPRSASTAARVPIVRTASRAAMRTQVRICTGRIASILAAVGRPAGAADAGWSNRQLARFWPWNSRFESLPRSVRVRVGQARPPAPQ
jgi:hypothetical protein